jgi:hypothetical protein
VVTPLISSNWMVPLGCTVFVYSTQSLGELLYTAPGHWACVPLASLPVVTPLVSSNWMAAKGLADDDTYAVTD